MSVPFELDKQVDVIEPLGTSLKDESMVSLSMSNVAAVNSNVRSDLSNNTDSLVGASDEVLVPIDENDVNSFASALPDSIDKYEVMSFEEDVIDMAGMPGIIDVSSIKEGDSYGGKSANSSDFKLDITELETPPIQIEDLPKDLLDRAADESTLGSGSYTDGTDRSSLILNLWNEDYDGNPDTRVVERLINCKHLPRGLSPHVVNQIKRARIIKQIRDIEDDESSQGSCDAMFEGMCGPKFCQEDEGLTDDEQSLPKSAVNSVEAAFSGDASIDLEEFQHKKPKKSKYALIPDSAYKNKPQNTHLPSDLVLVLPKGAKEEKVNLSDVFLPLQQVVKSEDLSVGGDTYIEEDMEFTLQKYDSTPHRIAQLVLQGKKSEAVDYTSLPKRSVPSTTPCVEPEEVNLDHFVFPARRVPCDGDLIEADRSVSASSSNDPLSETEEYSLKYFTKLFSDPEYKMQQVHPETKMDVETPERVGCAITLPFCNGKEETVEPDVLPSAMQFAFESELHAYMEKETAIVEGETGRPIETASLPKEVEAVETEKDASEAGDNDKSMFSLASLRIFAKQASTADLDADVTEPKSKALDGLLLGVTDEANVPTDTAEVKADNTVTETRDESTPDREETEVPIVEGSSPQAEDDGRTDDEQHQPVELSESDQEVNTSSIKHELVHCIEHINEESSNEVEDTLMAYESEGDNIFSDTSPKTITILSPMSMPDEDDANLPSGPPNLTGVGTDSSEGGQLGLDILHTHTASTDCDRFSLNSVGSSYSYQRNENADPASTPNQPQPEMEKTCDIEGPSHEETQTHVKSLTLCNGIKPDQPSQKVPLDGQTLTVPENQPKMKISRMLCDGASTSSNSNTGIEDLMAALDITLDGVNGSSSDESLTPTPSGEEVVFAVAVEGIAIDPADAFESKFGRIITPEEFDVLKEKSMNMSVLDVEEMKSPEVDNAQVTVDTPSQEISQPADVMVEPEGEVLLVSVDVPRQKVLLLPAEGSPEDQGYEVKTPAIESSLTVAGNEAKVENIVTEASEVKSAGLGASKEHMSASHKTLDNDGEILLVSVDSPKQKILLLPSEGSPEDQGHEAKKPVDESTPVVAGNEESAGPASHGTLDNDDGEILLVSVDSPKQKVLLLPVEDKTTPSKESPKDQSNQEETASLGAFDDAEILAARSSPCSNPMSSASNSFQSYQSGLSPPCKESSSPVDAVITARTLVSSPLCQDEVHLSPDFFRINPNPYALHTSTRTNATKVRKGLNKKPMSSNNSVSSTTIAAEKPRRGKRDRASITKTARSITSDTSSIKAELDSLKRNMTRIATKSKRSKEKYLKKSTSSHSHLNVVPDTKRAVRHR